MRRISSLSVAPNSRGDLLLAWRQAFRRPGFSALAIGILAVGIGLSVAVFSVMYQVLWKPQPYPEPERLVVVHNSFPLRQVPLTGVSAWDYVQISRHREAFESAGIFYFNDLTLAGAGPARHVDVVNASATLFQVLRAIPALGRLPSEADDRYGSPGVVLLSDSFWRGAFGADAGVVGRSVRLNDAPYTVIGVMRPEFRFPYASTQMWVPLALRPAEFSAQGRQEKWLRMLARVAGVADRERVDAALQVSARDLVRSFPGGFLEKEGWHLATRALTDEQTEGIRHWLWLAFGAVAGVLLIACSNVSGLLLMRAAGRRSEMALRTALGANRFRMVRQVLVEVGLLSGTACAVGLLLAGGCVHLLNHYGVAGEAADVGLRPVGFALCIALMSTLSAGLVPAWMDSKRPIEQALRKGPAHVTGRRTRQGGIVAAQIAAAVALLFTATLLGRSFLKLMQVPVGFDATHLWSAAVEVPASRRSEGSSRHTQFFGALQDRLAALPGVLSASASNALPFNPSGIWTEELRLPGRERSDTPAQAQICIALPRYFETMRIPLLRRPTSTQETGRALRRWR